MSEGLRGFEPSSPHTLRPIIPTPHSSLQLRPDSQNQIDNDATSLLRHYYNNYLRLFKENGVLTNQLAIITSETDQLKQKFELLKIDQDEKRKRHRRVASQISRNFRCPIDQCDKSYGSEASLLQHIKIKHQEFYQSQAYETLLLSKHKKNKQKLITYQLTEPKKE